MVQASRDLQDYEFVQGVRFPRTMQGVFFDILDDDGAGVDLFEYNMKVTGRFMASHYATPDQRSVVRGLLLGYLAVEDSYSVEPESLKDALNTYADSRHVPQAEKSDLLASINTMMQAGENKTARTNAIDIVVHRLTYANDPLDQRFHMAHGLIEAFKDGNAHIRQHAAEQAGYVMANAADVGQPLWMLDEIDAHVSKMDMGIGNDSATLAALKHLAESTKSFVNHWKMRSEGRLKAYQGEALSISEPLGRNYERAVMLTPPNDTHKAVGVVRTDAHEITHPYNMPLRLVSSYAGQDRNILYQYAEFFGVEGTVSQIEHYHRERPQLPFR